MWTGRRIKTCQDATDAERTYSSFLCVFLLGLGDEFGYVFDWGIIVIIETIALTLDSRLIRQDTAIGCQPRVSHIDMIVELNYLLDCFPILQLCH
jgi:hypothetical protein